MILKNSKSDCISQIYASRDICSLHQRMDICIGISLGVLNGDKGAFLVMPSFQDTSSIWHLIALIWHHCDRPSHHNTHVFAPTSMHPRFPTHSTTYPVQCWARLLATRDLVALKRMDNLDPQVPSPKEPTKWKSYITVKNEFNKITLSILLVRKWRGEKESEKSDY